jgi:hypothetical protein
MNFNTRKFSSAARFALLCACALALAACATDGTVPKTETLRTQAAKPSEPVRDTEPMTHSRAARECWMRTEKGNTREDLDKRADLVNKCIDEKMKAARPPAPNT